MTSSRHFSYPPPPQLRIEKITKGSRTLINCRLIGAYSRTDGRNVEFIFAVCTRSFFKKRSAASLRSSTPREPAPTPPRRRQQRRRPRGTARRARSPRPGVNCAVGSGHCSSHGFKSYLHKKDIPMFFQKCLGNVSILSRGKMQNNVSRSFRSR